MPAGRRPHASPVRVGISSCLLGERRPLRRRPQARHLPDRDVRDVGGMGAGLPRGRMRARHAAGVDAPGAGGRRRAAADGQDRRRSDRSDGGIRSTPRRAARVGGPVRLRAQEGLAKLRPRTRQGLRRAWNVPARSGRGLFASLLVERFPSLPVEEEGRLSDPRLRENFVERVFAYSRLRGLFSGRWTAGDVVRFHTAHKLMLLAHSPQAYQRLGRLVARVRDVPRRRHSSGSTRRRSWPRCR